MSHAIDHPEASLAAEPFSWRAVVRALRPHQWLKNLLLFVPLLMNHQFDDATHVVRACLGFVAFSAAASAGYVINDLLDRRSDRAHPEKRRRPFASGALSPGLGVGMVAALLAFAFAISVIALPLLFEGMLAVYVVLTVVYSSWLKRRLLIDVFVLAGLYAHRLLAGGAATDTAVSHWLLAFATFMFLSLAFAKRYAELLRVKRENDAGQPDDILGRAYRLEDIEIVKSVGPTSGYLAVLVLAFYINGDKVTQLYACPPILWLVCPLVLYWITRIWFLAQRGVLPEDPVIYAFRDRISYATLVLLVLIVALAWKLPTGLLLVER